MKRMIQYPRHVNVRQYCQGFFRRGKGPIMLGLLVQIESFCNDICVSFGRACKAVEEGKGGLCDVRQQTVLKVRRCRHMTLQWLQSSHNRHHV